jgi:ankyrin repeat protein
VKDIVGGLPYDFGLSVDMDKKKRKLNKMLQDEKKEFMNKLNLTRFVRSKLETNSVLRLQALYRGYYVRNNFEEIRHYLGIHKMIRSNLRSYLESESYPISTLAQYHKKRQEYRHLAAKLIQAFFKRYLSRQCFRRKKYSQFLLMRSRSAIIIQSLTRGVIARGKVRSILDKKSVSLRLKSVIQIQSAMRKLFAKRRVLNRRYKLQWLAARMIQCWYRAKYSRRMARHIKQALYFRRANRAALLMQGIVRRFLSIRRVNRIRMRKFFITITRPVIRIQCLIRCFLARIAVQRKRSSVRMIREEKLSKQKSQEELLAKEKESKENQALLESANIFLQAKRGNTVDVEDIFMGLVGGEEHTAEETDENDDNLFTIAASLGNNDLLRKCLMWGFDINHRNKDGMTAIMLAAKNQQFQAFSYLLSFHPQSKNQPQQIDSSLARSSSQDGNTTALVGGGGGAGEEKLKNIHLELNDDDIGFLFVQAAYYVNHPVSSATSPSSSDLTMLQCLVSLGFDINSVSSNHGNTSAIHVACEIGNPDAFKYLFKQKAKVDVKDEVQQLPLHKAVTSNILLVKWILGLDPNFQTYMSPENRIANLTSLDADGKDCLLLAILKGKIEIVVLLEAILSNNGQYSEGNEGKTNINAEGSSNNLAHAKSASVSSSAGGGGSASNVHPSASVAASNNKLPTNIPSAMNNEEIGWSVTDIQAVIELVENNNLFCFHKVISYGFDINWLQDMTNRSLPMIACWIGDFDILELLLNLSADFGTLDENDESVFHYAIKPHPKHLISSSSSSHSVNQTLYKKKDGIIPFLLSHPFKSKCNITPNLLLQCSKKNKENCFHYAAKDGLELNIDLLIDTNLLQQAMHAKNEEGQTPFQVACCYYQEKIIQNYLKLGANIHHEDSQGNNCFWYLFHPNKERVLCQRRVFTSEYNLQTSTSISRKERDEENNRIQSECNLVGLFLKNGCRLYTKLKSSDDHLNMVTPEKLKETLFPPKPPQANLSSSSENANYDKDYERLEPGDILLYEYSYTFLKMIIPNLVSPLDAWRLRKCFLFNCIFSNCS